MIEKYGHEHKEHVVVDANVLVYVVKTEIKYKKCISIRETEIRNRNDRRKLQIKGDSQGYTEILLLSWEE